MAVARNGDVWINWRSHGKGEPLLMIMGLSGSSKAWGRLLPHVAAQYEAIVMDNRGTGDSDPVSAPLSMSDMVGDALAVLDAAGLGSAHVIGVSMGGMIAQHLALDHRERVRSLILGCTTAGGAHRAQPPWRLLAATAMRPFVAQGDTWPIIAPALYAQRTRDEHPQRVLEDLAVRTADATSLRTTLGQMAAMPATTRAIACTSWRASRRPSSTAKRTPWWPRHAAAGWPRRFPARDSSQSPHAAT